MGAAHGNAARPAGGMAQRAISQPGRHDQPQVGQALDEAGGERGALACQDNGFEGPQLHSQLVLVKEVVLEERDWKVAPVRRCFGIPGEVIDDGDGLE